MTNPTIEVLNRILIKDGVLAVATTTQSAGDPAIVAVATVQLGMFDLPYMAEKHDFRVNIGHDDASIMAMRSGDQRIAIAVIAGHPFVKSCKRTARRALVKLAKASEPNTGSSAEPEPGDHA